MALAFDARDSTKDVDAIALDAASTSALRDLVGLVAEEYGWPADWLNDGAKGYLVGISDGPVVLAFPGIEVRRPGASQLLAMKLCAWRDDVDVSDARILLQETMGLGAKEVVWGAVSRFLPPGTELKAQYAFDDLWEEAHG